MRPLNLRKNIGSLFCHSALSRRFLSLTSLVMLMLLSAMLLSTFLIQGKEEHRPDGHRSSLLPVPVKRYPAAAAIINRTTIFSSSSRMHR